VEGKVTPERAVVSDLDGAEIEAEFLEDLARYRFAAGFVGGLRVLDVACGSGYGSRLLASVGQARLVLGIDVAAEALAQSRRHRRPGQVLYARAAAERLPLPAAAVEAVVSLETLEHVRDPAAFLRELRRVLKPGGCAVVSTPLNETEGRLRPENPYHVREFSAAELAALVGDAFAGATFYSQVTDWADDLHPGLQRLSPVKTAKALLKRVLPPPLRAHLRRALGSRGLHPTATRVEPGILPGAAVQIAVCR
jgi:2-polyprenyl-3-methyl-5-hydroxy-6-metoxy-1,4-benzoquinol methylase